MDNKGMSLNRSFVSIVMKIVLLCCLSGSVVAQTTVTTYVPIIVGEITVIIPKITILDTTPDQFYFIPSYINRQPLNTLVTVEITMPLSGFVGTVDAVVTGEGYPEIAKNSEENWVGVGSSLPVSAGDTIKLRMWTADDYSTSRSADVTVSGVGYGISVVTNPYIPPDPPRPPAPSPAPGPVDCSAYSVAPYDATSLAEGTYQFRVTGSIDGSGWGDYDYREDSNIATMAVHTGVVENGATEVISLVKWGGIWAYTGSDWNGVITEHSEGGSNGTYNIYQYADCDGSSGGGSGGGTGAPVISSVYAESGDNFLDESNQITIMQNEDFLLQWDTDAEQCTVDAGALDQAQNLAVNIKAGTSGAELILGAYYFDVAQDGGGNPVPTTANVLLSCSNANSADTADAEFELTVVPDQQHPKLPPPEVTSLWMDSPSNNFADGTLNINLAFDEDQSEDFGWSVSDAEQCYIDDRAYPYPANFSGTFEPYRFQFGHHEHSFYCEGTGGRTEPILVTFDVTDPNPNAATFAPPPGFRGEYNVYLGETNGDGKPDIRVEPVDPETSGVAEFVLESFGSGYVVSGYKPASWALANGPGQIDLVFGDFNADGLDDMMLKNLTGDPNDDVITYAPYESRSTPDFYVVTTEYFRQFFDEMYQLVLNPNYYAEHSAQEERTIEFYSIFAGFSCDSIGGLSISGLSAPITINFGCSYDLLIERHKYSWQATVKVDDYGNPVDGGWHHYTKDMSSLLPVILNAGVLEAGQDPGVKLTVIMSNVLRAPFMGNVLVANNGSRLFDENFVPDSVLPEYRAGKLLASTVACDPDASYILYANARMGTACAAAIISPVDGPILDVVLCSCYLTLEAYTLITAVATKEGILEDVSDSNGQCNVNQTKEGARSNAYLFAGISPNSSTPIPWSQYHWPSMASGIEVTELIQAEATLGHPYGHEAPNIGDGFAQVVHHLLPDGSKPCPHFHAFTHDHIEGIFEYGIGL